jgi:lipopolysaccharide/colanic/teichoic acid biosynthesis glycosyltransferase
MSVLANSDHSGFSKIERSSRVISSIRSPAQVEYGSYDTFIKPLIDCLLTLVVSPVIVPLVLLAMVAVRLTSDGPVLYAQTRLGRRGRTFTMYKIRSMYHDCERETGPRWCAPSDPRITPVGWILRKTHIDELPQLWNILCGDLSWVGPRPERPEIATELTMKVPEFLHRLDVRPGLSGLAQVQQGPDESLETVRRKLFFDLHYVDNLGFWLDMRIILATVPFIAGLPAAWICRVFGLPSYTGTASRARTNRESLGHRPELASTIRAMIEGETFGPHNTSVESVAAVD